MTSRLAEEWATFLLAVQFLTRIPVNPEWSEARMAATPRWYPAVGLLIGAGCALVFFLSAALFSPLIAVLISTAFGVILTGAFHEDGFADCCDGLGGAVSRDRALEIMRDSRLGTYGAIGLGLIVATKIASLTSVSVETVPWLLIGAHALSRASSIAVIATSTYVRDHGTGKPVATGTDGMAIAIATSLIVLGLLAFAVDIRLALGALLGLIVGHIAMRRVFERRLGGYTGDCLGAVQQTSEVGMYLGALVVLALP